MHTCNPNTYEAETGAGHGGTDFNPSTWEDKSVGLQEYESGLQNEIQYSQVYVKRACFKMNE